MDIRVQSYEDFVDEVLADMKADISMSDDEKQVLLGMLTHSYMSALIKQLGGAKNERS